MVLVLFACVCTSDRTAPASIQGAPPLEQSADTVNVREFGARGDGRADDAGAFARAVEALGSSGGVLYVPTGTYVLTPRSGRPNSSFDLSHRSHITVSGEGIEKTTLRMAAGSYRGDTHLVFLGKSAGITFRDLSLDGNRDQASFVDEQNHCVEVWSSTDVRFEYVRFHNCRGDGIRLMGAPRRGEPWTDRVSIENSVFENNGRSGIAVQRAVRNLVIVRNTFEDIRDQSIDVEPTGAVAPTDILIEDNVIRHTTRAWAVGIGGIGGAKVAQRITFRRNRVENGSVIFYKADDVVIEANTILGDPYHPAALRLSHNMTNTRVIGNEFVGDGNNEGASGLQVVALNNHHPFQVIIQNNRVTTSPGVAGISVRDALGQVSILGNEIQGGGTSSGIQVVNNVLVSSPRSEFSILENVVRNFETGVRFSTQGDLFADVVIERNSIDHDQDPPRETIGILFDKTGPYEAFAEVKPNEFGPGVRIPIRVKGP